MEAAQGRDEAADVSEGGEATPTRGGRHREQPGLDAEAGGSEAQEASLARQDESDDSVRRWERGHYALEDPAPQEEDGHSVEDRSPSSSAEAQEDAAPWLFFTAQEWDRVACHIQRQLLASFEAARLSRFLDSNAIHCPSSAGALDVCDLGRVYTSWSRACMGARAWCYAERSRSSSNACTGTCRVSRTWRCVAYGGARKQHGAQSGHAAHHGTALPRYPGGYGSRGVRYAYSQKMCPGCQASRQMRPSGCRLAQASSGGSDAGAEQWSEGGHPTYAGAGSNARSSHARTRVSEA